MENKTLSTQQESAPENAAVTSDQPPSPAVKLWTAKDIKSSHRSALRDKLLTIGFGLLLLVIVTIWNGIRDATGGTVTGCWSVLQYVMIIGGVGMILSGGKGFIGEAFDAPRWQREFTEKNPDIELVCSSCKQTIQVNRRRYEYYCQNCGEFNSWEASWGKAGAAAQLVKDGQPCRKCSIPNPLVDRAIWFTCPHCKAKVEYEKMPPQFAVN